MKYELGCEAATAIHDRQNHDLENQPHAVRTGFYFDKLVGTSVLCLGDRYLWRYAQRVIIILPGWRGNKQDEGEKNGSVDFRQSQGRRHLKDAQ